jgi:hypothetical protein
MADDQDPAPARLYKTERTKLLTDDREARVQDQGTKLYTKPDNSTPSLTNLRRTLPSRAITGQGALVNSSSRSLRGGKR